MNELLDAIIQKLKDEGGGITRYPFDCYGISSNIQRRDWMQSSRQQINKRPLKRFRNF